MFGGIDLVMGRILEGKKRKQEIRVGGAIDRLFGRAFLA